MKFTIHGDQDKMTLEIVDPAAPELGGMRYEFEGVGWIETERLAEEERAALSYHASRRQPTRYYAGLYVNHLFNIRLACKKITLECYDSPTPPAPETPAAEE